MSLLKYFFFIVLFVGLLNTNAQVQTENFQLEKKYSQQYFESRIKADSILKITNQPIRFETTDGDVVEFARFSETGQMLFYKTFNLGSARTISTDKVWPGGTTNTSLTGAGMTGKLGEWDAGGVLLSHQELGSKVTIADGATLSDRHSTHVAGTMVSQGKNPLAKGMAYEAGLTDYDWNNDVSEMINAGTSGMLLSNHSYGDICAWYHNSSKNRWEWYGDVKVSTTTDYKFGFYNQQTSDWDNVAYTNPNYLICKAAGNDRGHNIQKDSPWYYMDVNSNWVQGTGTPPSAVSQYDCIDPTACAKNILTVGAVTKINYGNNNSGWTKSSDVIMTTFSSWGPTDDGRIKPDVVAAGYQIYSCFNDSIDAYGLNSGTSMATPAATGSLLLVQQHYNNSNKKFMRSATLKGIAIHTADEAGIPGPDYTFGWGLLNIANAVKMISDSVHNNISERSLLNGNTFTQTITNDGSVPVKITICWTDIPATPRPASLNDTTRRLINDLDIRLRRISDNAIFYPYILNPNFPSLQATTGDNNRDNVEQIFISLPVAGSYQIIVSHKGSLASPQNFSLLVSGISIPLKVAISKNVSSVCIGQQVRFSDVTSGKVLSRTWYFPGGNPVSDTGANVNVTYGSRGSYPVVLKASNLLGTDSVYFNGAISVGGSNLPFSETFESNSPTVSMWTIDNPNLDTTWRLGNVAGNTPGTKAFCLPFFNYGQTGEHDGLITPPLSFYGLSSVNFSFQHAYTRFTGTPTDSLIVYISTNCGNTWNRLLALGENGTGNFATAPDNSFGSTSFFYPTSVSDWCGGGTGSSCYSFNLSSYVGLNNVKIKFEGVNNYGNNLYIDNVNFTGTLLAPTANFAASKTNVCIGEPVNFYDSSINIVSNYQWSFAGATVTNSTLQNPSGIIYNVPGVYSIKLIVSNVAGTDSVTKTNYITVNSLPNIPSVSSNKSPSLCIGDSIILSCDSIGTNYQWMNNDEKIPGANQKTFTVFSPGNYRVKIFNSNNCSAISPVINILPTIAAPIITPSVSGNGFCSGTTLQLNSSVSYGNHWYKNGTSNVADTNSVYSTTDSGTYSVRVIQNGCNSPMSQLMKFILLPKPPTLAISGKANSTVNSIDTFTVALHTGSYYTWVVIGGSQISGGNTNQVSFQWNNVAAGAISVTETNSSGCNGDQANTLVTLAPISVQEVFSLKYFVVFPNPADKIINIEFENSVKQNVEITLVNVLGQKVYYEKITLFTGHFSKQISVSDFLKGVYFMESKTEDGSKQMKLVVN